MQFLQVSTLCNPLMSRNACNGENGETGEKSPASGDLNWMPKVAPWRLAILAKMAIVAKLAILAKIARNACNGVNGKKLPASGDLNWMPKVRIHCLLYFNLAFFYEFCDFPQILWSDAIWGQLCKIAPSCNIRWPVFTIKTLLIPKYSQLPLWRTLLKGTLPASH